MPKKKPSLVDELRALRVQKSNEREQKLFSKVLDRIKLNAQKGKTEIVFANVSGSNVRCGEWSIKKLKELGLTVVKSKADNSITVRW